MNSSYNQQILAQRKAKGLSRKEAARQIGISSFSLFLYENGYFKPTRKALAKIENYYGFNVDYTGDNEYPSATHEEKDNYLFYIVWLIRFIYHYRFHSFC